MVTHRRATYLASSLESILSQTRPADEIVVSEDGEDEATRTVVEALIERGAPIRHFSSATPLGEGGNRKRALGLTTGDLVAMLDDDDEYEPEFLERAEKALDTHPECVFAMADHWIIDENGRKLAAASEEASRRFGRDVLSSGVHRDVLIRHLQRKTMTLVTSLFRRPALAEFDFLPFIPPVTSADFVFWTELGARQASVVYIAERLGRYRVHTGQSTSRHRINRTENVLRTLERVAAVYDLGPAELTALASLHRKSVIELAIAYAHVRRRTEALRVLCRYGDHGWAVPSSRRFVVLLAVLVGARHRRPKG